MKTTKILAILVLGFMFCQSNVSEAVEMGTAFTYQGHLYDNNDVANDLYDFEFKLYKYEAAPVNDYIQVGNDVNKPDVEVIDGYFTVELDFGSSVFDGEARWLQIGVRPGVQSDPCEYTPLSPLQEITPVPYTLQTRGIFVSDDGKVGIGTTEPTWRLTIEEGGLNVFAGGSGETVGFSTERFYVAGNNENYIMEIGDSPSDYTEFFDDGVSTLKIINNKVGIGTQSPDAKLDISGNVKVDGSVDASDAVIMATNTGSGDGVEGTSWGSSGRGVDGWALYSGPGTNYGGYFRAASSGGMGVYGEASNSGDYENYGGYFIASGDQGRGVYGFVIGDNGHAVQGMAFDSGAVTNYGGYFTARGASGRAVYGEATKTGTAENYGGYFTAAGEEGIAVYAEAKGSYGTAVYGHASDLYLDANNYGGYFISEGKYGAGVYGKSTSSLDATFGGYFECESHYGYGAYGINSNNNANNDGYGVYGKHAGSENYGYLGSKSCGVYGKNASGTLIYGYLGGSNNGVYGYSWAGIGVYGATNSGYAAYFDGLVYVTGVMSAETVIDRTPYPRDIETAYEAVMSMGRLPDGQYDENNREVQLDHSRLSSFIRSKDGNRNLSATVSCLNEVVKDLVRKVEDQQRLIKIQNTQIQQMAKKLQTNIQPQAVITKGATQ